jgi:CHRD domain
MEGPVRRIHRPLLAPLTLACVVLGAAPAAAEPAWQAELAGSEVIPGPGALEPAEGWLVVSAAPGGRPWLCYKLIVKGIAPATGAHLNRGDEGQTGPVVAQLVPPTDGDLVKQSEACSMVDESTLAEVTADPAQFYVQVDNDEHPEGAIRGQLH